MENLEGFLTCVLLIIKLCSAVLPLISAIQSFVRKRKDTEDKEITPATSENLKNT